MTLMNSVLNRASSGGLVLIALVTAVLAAQQPAPPQRTDTSQGYREIVEYEGTTTVQTSRGPKALTIVIKKLTFDPRQRAVRLPLPGRGVVILQHRAGEVEIVIGQQRRKALEGERLTVNLPQSVLFTTADDTVSIDIIIVSEA